MFKVETGFAVRFCGGGPPPAGVVTSVSRLALLAGVICLLPSPDEVERVKECLTMHGWPTRDEFPPASGQ